MGLKVTPWGLKRIRSRPQVSRFPNHDTFTKLLLLRILDLKGRLLALWSLTDLMASKDSSCKVIPWKIKHFLLNCHVQAQGMWRLGYFSKGNCIERQEEGKKEGERRGKGERHREEEEEEEGGERGKGGRREGRRKGKKGEGGERMREAGGREEEGEGP